MFKYFLIACFLWAGSIFSPLQSQNLSLPEQLEALLDSAKVCYDKRSVEAGLKFSQEASELARQLNDESGLLAAHFYKASFYFDMRNLAKAQEHYTITEQLAEEQGDTLKLIKGISGQANVLTLQGQNLKSLLKNYKAKALAHGFDQDIYFGILSNMSVPYTKLGQYDNVLTNLLEALAHYKNVSKNDHAIAIIYNNIGELYREHLKDHDLALKHFLKAVELNIKIADEFQLAKNYNNIGLNFKHMEVTDSALYYLEKSKILKEKIGDVGGVAIAHFNLGELFFETGNYGEAISNFEETLRISKEFGIDEGFFHAYQGLGKSYSHLGQSEKALGYLEKAKAIANRLNNEDLKMTIKEAFYDYYKETGAYLDGAS